MSLSLHLVVPCCYTVEVVPNMLILAVKSLRQDSAPVLRVFGPLFDEHTSVVLTAFGAITKEVERDLQ